MIYPDFFPCPDWNYNQNLSEHIRRVQFDNGWTRQRKRFPERDTKMQMEFVCGTRMFASWSAWMQNNGYVWFQITLEGVQETIRLISPLNYNYRGHDVVTVTVTAEKLVAPRPETNPVPVPPQTGRPLIPGTGVYCLVYDCAAYEDALVEQGYDVLTLWSPTATLGWPFATSATEGGKLNVWGNYISSADRVDDWSGSFIDLVAAPDFVQNPSFCDGEVMMAAEVFTNASQTAWTPKSSDSTEGQWGPHSISMAFTGRDGTNFVNGEFARGTGCPYTVRVEVFPGDFSQIQSNPTIYANMDALNTDDITIQLSSDDADFGGPAAAVVTGFTGTWSAATFTATGGVPYVEEDIDNPGRFAVYQDCEASLTVNSVSVAKSWRHKIGDNFYSASVVGPYVSRLRYDGAIYFRQGEGYTIAQLGSQVFLEGEEIEIDVEALHEAWARNYSSYEDPDEDCIPVPS